jgi:hypothetical protein
VLLLVCGVGYSQDPPVDESAPPAAPEPDPSEYMRPTERGLRLTPKIAEAMSKKFVENMTTRYDLDQGQGKAITEIMARRIMRFSHENEKTGQELIEYMMAAMIENDGRFTRDAAMEFARMAKPIIPNLKDLFTKMGADIGQEMSLKQRLKFTGDMTAAAAGITIFESRMKRWEEGQIGDNANPFWDPADNDPSKAQPTPTDPNEHPDHRRARIDAERWIEWRLRVDEDWDTYVKQASEYYQFDEKQIVAAQAVLKECKERAAKIKTDRWRDKIKENRIARELIRRADVQSRGPSLFALEADFEQLQKPLLDLDDELKKRIDGLPDSKQRATAKSTVRQMLVDRGMKEPPL